MARDNEGAIVGGMNRKLRNQDIVTMEAIEIYKGLRLADEKGWTNITIKSDAELVIQQITGKH